MRDPSVRVHARARAHTRLSVCVFVSACHESDVAKRFCFDPFVPWLQKEPLLNIDQKGLFDAWLVIFNTR